MKDEGDGRLPTGREAQEIGLLAALLMVALYGFGQTYGGWSYLVAGGLGVLLGLVVSHVSDRLRAPAVTAGAVTVAVFFLLGGSVALSGSTGPVPNRDTLTQLAQAATHGWDQLLTVVPPVGTGGNLLAIPYLLGLAGAVLGHLLTRRTTKAWAPLLPPVAVLAVAILFGTQEPASLLVQGAGFAVLALAWLGLRGQTSVAATGADRLAALGRVVAVLAVAAAGAVLLGPRMPLTGAHERVILREHVDPPFDPRDYGSPLSGFRKYVLAGRAGDTSLGDEVLFTAEGVPAGSLVHVATMDEFDGVLWNAAGRPASSADVTGTDSGSGWFQRVGDVIPTAQTGDRATIRISIGALGGVWMPSVGASTRVRFTGPAAEELATTFRYNRSTGTGVTGTRPAGRSRGLRPGDGYTAEVVVPPVAYAEPRVSPEVLDAAGPLAVTLPEQGVVLDAVKNRAADLIGDAAGVHARAAQLAAGLRKGSFSNGEPSQQISEPGHDAARLTAMVAGADSMVGNAEQYAALLAVMARQAGLPARVVMGVRAPDTVPARWPVKGPDMTAWVEVGLEGVGWVPVFPTPDQTRQKPEPQPKPEINPRVPDPPKVVVPPRIDVDASSSGQRREPPPDDDPDGSGIPAVVLVAGGVLLAPLLATALTAAVITLLKARRRRRRREQGPAVTRIAGGWAEFVDTSRDFGTPQPPRGTRREVAGFVGGSSAVGLAERADAAIFGPGEPTADDVRDYWADVDGARRRLSGERTRRERLRAALNVTSLRR